MPQLDFSVFPSQLFWLCISFFTMLFIMSKFIIPKIAEMINLRKEKIDDYLDSAADFKARSEQALENYHRALKEATDEANLSLQKTKQEMKNLIERKQTELNEELCRQIKEGEQQIRDSKAKAMKQVDAMTEDLAAEIIRKLGFSLTKAQISKAAAAEKE